MNFANKTGLKQVDDAIIDAKRLLKPTSTMMRDICMKTDWRYDSGSSFKIVDRLRTELHTEVVIYFPSNKRTSAIGRMEKGRIELNGYRANKLSHPTLVGLLLHEHSHKCGFHHVDPGWIGRKLANFKTKNKCLYSVPYFLSENVSRWL